MKKQKNIHTHQFKQIIAVMLAIIFISGALMIFSVSVNERKEEINYISLQDLAIKSTAFVNEEIRHYLELLESTVQLFDDYELHDPMLLDKVGKIVEKSDFQRFGIADETGNSYITNGMTLDISDRDYFKASMEGNVMVSDALNSELIGEKIVICSVPVYNQNNEIRGVFYGVLELEKIRIFNENLLETEYQYVHIIDSNGDYIYQSRHGDKITDDSDNFFEGIANLKRDMSLIDIQNRVKNGESITVQVEKEEDERLVYFNPLEKSQWTAVCVVDKDFMLSGIDGLIRKDVFLFIIAVSSALVLLGAVLFHYSKKEKEYIYYLYEKIERNEEIYRTIAIGQNKIVFIYNVKKDSVRFISGKLDILPLNTDILNASTTIPKLLNDNEDIKKAGAYILEKFASKERYFSVEVSFEKDHHYSYYEVEAHCIFDEKGQAETYVGNVEEITEEKEKEKSLIQKAEIDSLTRVYNREGGVQKIKEHLSQSGEHAFVLLDLDRFKELNDTLGHQKGDQALIDVSRILTQHFHSEDIICRLGGDEFVAFIENISEEVILKVIDALLKKLQLSYTLFNKTVDISASIGIVLVPKDGVDFVELYKKADQALYQAKSKGKNCSCLYKELRESSEK